MNKTLGHGNEQTWRQKEKTQKNQRENNRRRWDLKTNKNHNAETPVIKTQRLWTTKNKHLIIPNNKKVQTNSRTRVKDPGPWHMTEWKAAYNVFCCWNKKKTILLNSKKETVWKFLLVKIGHFLSFELQLVKVRNKHYFYCGISSNWPNRLFWSELSDFLSFTMKLFRLLIVVDFNIHVDDDADLFARDFINTMDSFQFCPACVWSYT